MHWNSTIMYTTREGSRGGLGMDSQQQFCLKWNSFGSNLATAFSNLWKSESLADVTLFCGGRHFKAHRLILAACSKHFQELFKGAPPSHVGACYVILEATSAENMQALLEFMYKGEVHVSSDALPSFLKSAESLQVKGLSIEHEKLAYAQTFAGDRHAQMKPSPGGGATVGGCEAADSAMPQQLGSASFAPILTPYALHPLHGAGGVAGAVGPAVQSGRYPPPSAHNPPHPNAHRRPAPLKPSPSPSPHARNYRPSSSSSHCDEPDTRSSPGGGAGGGAGGGGGGRYDDIADCPSTPTTTTGLKNNGYERSASADDMLERRLSTDQGAEDLRVKMEIEYHGGGYSAPPTPTAAVLSSNYQDKPPEAAPTPPNPGPDIWTKKLASSKSGGIATADGKKLKCPFCERLYGYETNLRAHIRQRHQGIRVPCPYCSRTFTRNNTVRRHIAREHKHDADLKAHLPQGPVHNHAQ